MLHSRYVHLDIATVTTLVVFNVVNVGLVWHLSLCDLSIIIVIVDADCVRCGQDSLCDVAKTAVAAVMS